MQPLTCAPEPVVLDTNAVLDWQLFADPRASLLWQALAQGRLRWLVSQAMLDELVHVLRRPWDTRWSTQRECLLDRSSWPEARIVQPDLAVGHSLRCKDPDDQKFLDLALQHRVRWLVTRDRALLDLRRTAARFGLSILPPEQWSPLH